MLPVPAELAEVVIRLAQDVAEVTLEKLRPHARVDRPAPASSEGARFRTSAKCSERAGTPASSGKTRAISSSSKESAKETNRWPSAAA